MKKLFIIGGMGAGKSTARKALVEQGLPNIDLDQVGHDVLLWDTVKSERDAQAQPHHAAAHRRGVHRPRGRAGG